MLSHITDVWVGAFIATEFSKIFSGCVEKKNQ
jgi:hypothetical protein